MRIAGYKIDLSEIDKRIIAAFIVLILGLIFWFFFRGEEAPPDPGLTPGQGVTVERVNQFESEGQNWFTETFGENVDLREPSSNDQLYQITNRGEPVNFRALISSDSADDFPELFLTNENINFKTGFFVPPTTKLASPKEINSIQDASPLQFAFPTSVGDAPDGFLIQVQGMLWYQSDQIQAGSIVEGVGAVPTILVSSYQEVSPVELSSPAQYIASLNQTYQQFPYRVNIKTIEWVSGAQLRVCVAVKNISKIDQPLWEGVDGGGTSAIYGREGEVSGGPADDGPFDNSSKMAPGLELADYVVFGDSGDTPPIGSPQAQLKEPLRLIFPGLVKSNSDKEFRLEFRVGAGSFVSTSEADTQGILTGCSTD